MSRDLRLYLTDILIAGEKVLSYTEGMNFENFVADDRTFDAVIRNFQKSNISTQPAISVVEPCGR